MIWSQGHLNIEEKKQCYMRDERIQRIISGNGVARALKNYAHQRETTRSSNVSLQFRPFSKLELLFRERICFQRERALSFMSSSLKYGKTL